MQASVHERLVTLDPIEDSLELHPESALEIPANVEMLIAAMPAWA
jgi:hypothetical protein